MEVTGTYIDARRFCVESWPYRVEMFAGADGDTKFSNGSKGFYCYVSTRFGGDDWVDQTPLRRDRDAAMRAAETLCRKHWRKNIKPTMEKKNGS